MKKQGKCPVGIKELPPEAYLVTDPPKDPKGPPKDDSESD